MQRIHFGFVSTEVNADAFSLGVGKFPRERIELHARYGWTDFDRPDFMDLEQSEFGLGVRFRF